MNINIDQTEFIADGRDPNIRDEAKNTPLHWAAGAGHPEAIAYLLSLPNIDLTAQNLLGDTALHRVSTSIQNLFLLIFPFIVNNPYTTYSFRISNIDVLII